MTDTKTPDGDAKAIELTTDKGDAGQLSQGLKPYSGQCAACLERYEIDDADLRAAGYVPASESASRSTVGSRDGWAVRPVVRWFAEQMEAALRRNDHKGGWHEDEPVDLERRVRDEARELRDLVDIDEPTTNEKLRTINEAADVANMTMMVADHYREGGPSTDQGMTLPASVRTELGECPEGEAPPEGETAVESEQARKWGRCEFCRRPKALYNGESCINIHICRELGYKRLRAAEAKLTEQQAEHLKALSDLQFQLGKAQGEAEGLAILRNGEQAEHERVVAMLQAALELGNEACAAANARGGRLEEAIRNALKHGPYRRELEAALSAAPQASTEQVAQEDSAPSPGAPDAGADSGAEKPREATQSNPLAPDSPGDGGGVEPPSAAKAADGERDCDCGAMYSARPHADTCAFNAAQPATGGTERCDAVMVMVPGGLERCGLPRNHGGACGAPAPTQPELPGGEGPVKLKQPEPLSVERLCKALRACASLATLSTTPESFGEALADELERP